MKIHVTDHNGAHELEALAGWRVMEIIRDWDLPIKAECGGACACATCHVYVSDDWFERLPKKTDEEIDQLEILSDRRNQFSTRMPGSDVGRTRWPQGGPGARFARVSAHSRAAARTAVAWQRGVRESSEQPYTGTAYRRSNRCTAKRMMLSQEYPSNPKQMIPTNTHSVLP